MNPVSAADLAACPLPLLAALLGMQHLAPYALLLHLMLRGITLN